MFDDLHLFDFYTITVTRDHLDKLMAYFSQIGEVTLGVESTGEVTFNIPKNSDINIVEINVFRELFRKVEKLEQEQQTLSLKSKRFKEIEQEKETIKNSIPILAEIFISKINFQIDELNEEKK